MTASPPRSAIPDCEGLGHRWPSRTQPRCRRDHPGDPPGLRLTPRRCALRHRPPVLRPQDRHRPRAGFDTLRQRGGLTGYQERAESEHDWIESSARVGSAVLCRRPGQGLRIERAGPPRRGRGRRRGTHRRHVLGGAEQHRRRPTVRWSSSSTTTAGPTRRPSAASPEHLTGLRLQPGYERLLDEGRSAVRNCRVLGQIAYAVLHGVKAASRTHCSPQAMFTDLGLKYVGPIDGHDEDAVETRSAGRSRSVRR